MADDLLRYRSQFPILERSTYLISNSLGAMPQAVYEALKGYADIWATRGVRAWEERWWMLAAQVGDEIGALMNAPPGSVSTHQNVTTCQAVVASCFDFSGKRNKVVYCDLNFPSVMYFWEAQQACGARVQMVPTDDGITVPTERLLDAIDDRTLLVPVSHVIFRSAYIQDAKAIIEKRLHSREANFLTVLERSVFLNTLLYRKGISWTRLLSDLEKVMPPNVRVLNIRPYVSGKNQITLDLTVGAESPDAVNPLYTALESSPLFGGLFQPTFQPPTQAEPLYRYRVTVNYAQKL